MHRGFIKIHRKILNWEWKTKPNTVALFLHLLVSANHKTNRFRGVEIKAGQLAVGRRELAKQTGLSEQQIRTSLKHLKKSKEITSKATSEFSVITLVNWDLYQCNEKEATSTSTNNQPATNQQSTTNKNAKNEKKVVRGKNELEIFEGKKENAKSRNKKDIEREEINQRIIDSFEG